MEKKHQQKTPKEKRRNMEKRKEKSRDAARCRRSREQEIFTDLFSMLPLSKSESVSHLDKASIIRIAISYLKIRAIVKSIPVASEEEENRLRIGNADSLFLNALEGFLLVTTSDGDIVFISENVNRYLGLSQVDILGQSIYELSHPCDHAEIKEMLSTKDLKTSKSHFLRMKCTLTNKGRNVNIKSATYKVIQYSGRMIETESNTFSEFVKKEREENKEYAESPSSFVNEDFGLNEEKFGGSSSSSLSSSPPSSPTQQQVPSSSITPTFHFVAVGEPISHPANIEIPLGHNTFLSKHSLDMKFTYADERISSFFGYEPRTLIKKSVFDYHHAQDSISVRNCFKSLFHKGQSQTERYRFLACGGGYAWVLTQATVIYNNNTQKPQSVVCVNFVISGVENKDEIYSLCQLEDGFKSSSDVICSTNTSRMNQEDTESNVSDLLEHSPQRLIAKLTIDNTAKNSLEDADQVTRMLRPLSSSLTANDFLINSLSLTPDSDVCSPPPLSSFSTISSPSTSSLSPCSSSASGIDTTVHFAGDLDDEILFDNEDVAKLSELIDNDSAKCNSLIVDESMDRGCSIKLPPAGVEVPSSDSVDGDQNRKRDALPLPLPSPPIKVLSTISETPKPSTINVFVPFTEDMNTGFLGFGDDNTKLTMLEEAPEDLTHLAPTPGDVCVPLDETPITFILPDEMLLPECNFLLDTAHDDQNCDDNDNNVQKHHADKGDTNHHQRNDHRDLDFCQNYSNLSSSSTRSPSSNMYYNCKDELEPSSRPLSPLLIQNEDCGLAEFASQNSPLRQDTATVNNFLDFDLMNSPEEMDGLTSDGGGHTAPDSGCKSSSSLLPLTLEPDPLLPFVTNDYLWNCPTGESTTWSSAYGLVDSGSLSSDLDQTSSLAKLLTTKTDGIRRDEGEAAFAAAAAAAAMDAYESGLRNGTAATGPTAMTSCRRSGDKHLQLESSFEAVRHRFEGRSVKSSFDTLVGCKRGSTENWSRAGGSCKRSRPLARTLEIGNNIKMGERSSVQNNGQNTMIDDEQSAIAALARNDSVLMNLLVSGCDLNAGYVRVNVSS